MGQITKVNTFTAGTTALATEVNENFDDIYDEFNGNIDNNNITAGAGIVDTKLAQITAAGKVSGAALTLLGSIPSGAGTVPDINQINGFTTLVDGATVATDASNGNKYLLTYTQSFTLSNPTNAVTGQFLLWRFTHIRHYVRGCF